MGSLDKYPSPASTQTQQLRCERRPALKPLRFDDQLPVTFTTGQKAS
jgi:hypothetical protein